MFIFLMILLVICVLFVLSLMGRTGHSKLEALRGWAYAHRGLHGDGVPENSMVAFRKALDAGYGIELDVHLMADGTLAVIHDSSLKRTAGADVRIEDLTKAQLGGYRLEGTEEAIPEFREVLELFQGKAPLIIELKAVNNHAALTAAVCDALRDYSGDYCIESFDPRCIYWLKKHRPDIVRGQLTENFLKEKGGKLPFVLKFALTNQILNFLFRPDFIAYRFSDRKYPSVGICRKLWGIQGVAWTLTTVEDYNTAVAEGWIPIFEGFRPEIKTD